MSRIMEEYLKEVIAEYDIEIATKLLKQTKLTEKDIAELFNYDDKQMQVVKERVAVMS